MIDLDNLPRHPLMEQLVDDLCPNTTNAEVNRPFYRIMVAYFLSKMAAAMRATIDSPIIGEVPVNCFAVALAPSGFGKNTATGALERKAMKGFKKRFMKETMPTITEARIYDMAVDKALVSGKKEEDEQAKLQKDYDRLGPYAFSAKKATASSIEQLRSKLLVSDIGSINIQIDEIGMNLTDKFVMEGLTLFLELYDMGHTDQALTKNSSDNQRFEDMDGITPACLLAFGTASKLFDGSDTERTFIQLLDTGYARRCFFAWGHKIEEEFDGDFEALYDKLLDRKKNSSVLNLNTHFTELADGLKHNWRCEVPRATGILHQAYKIQCKDRMKSIPLNEDIRRTEMEHRHWKALKLAGALAFVDESMEITEEHFLAAVAVTEESGEALKKVLSPEKPFVKLAKFMTQTKEPLTHADLVDALAFYPNSGTARNEMMNLAQAWGYKNNVVIKKTFEDGIELFTADTLAETDLGDMIFTYSNDQAFHYTTEDQPVAFEDMQHLFGAPNLHWCNHRFEGGHRHDDKCIAGFNIVTVDVDGDTSLDFVHDVLSDYQFMTYTTKRHTPENHRFRLVMPITHILELSQEDYREFMNSFFTWLPFDSDHAANQRSKKWLTHDPSEVFFNEGTQILSPLPFIPKTSKNAEYHDRVKSLGNIGALERWFSERVVDGDRNNQMVKYALALLDSGMSVYEVEQRVLEFNKALPLPLDESEIKGTIMKTVAKKFAAAA